MSGESKPVSAKQLRANRRNAKQSTGPRTDEGKARSAKNAITHGTFCADLLLPGEDEAELVQLQQGIYGSLSPQHEMERELVDRVVAAQWRLRRLRGAERVALVPATRMGPADHRQELMDRAMRAADKSGIFSCFRRYGADPTAAEPEIDAMVDEDVRAGRGEFQPPPAVALAQDFSFMGSGVVDRLSKYQQRLEQSVHRAMRELRQLRKDLGEMGAMPPCPYLNAREEHEAESNDVEPSRGVVTSVTTSSQDPIPSTMCPNVPSAQNVQNEPISAHVSADDEGADTCEQSSRDVIIVRPTPIIAMSNEPTREQKRDTPSSVP